EVGRDDVAHIVRLEAEIADLGDRRLGRIGAGADEGGERQPELARVTRVGQAEAGVDQHESLGALDEQAVADDSRAGQESAMTGDQAGPARARRPAVEVVDPAGRGVHRGKTTLLACTNDRRGGPRAERGSRARTAEPAEPAAARA